MLRLVIVDDEALARQALRNLLQRDATVRVVGEAADGFSALELIAREQPDLLLVDIQMPAMDGFELVRRLGPEPPLVIFVTAYDQYAVRAFRSWALDYLLKPCSEQDLQNALHRARGRLRSNEMATLGRRMLEAIADGLPSAAEPPSTPDNPTYLQRFTARKRSRTVLVAVDEIEWIEADDYCVRVHVPGAAHVLRRSLKWFGERLDPALFVRVHRSALINLAHLREIEHRGPDDHVAILVSGTEVPLSRVGRELLREALPTL
ncbi:MAG: response regulator [Acidobacteriota bacterium]